MITLIKSITSMLCLKQYFLLHLQKK